VRRLRHRGDANALVTWYGLLRMNRLRFIVLLAGAICPPYSPWSKRTLGYGWCMKCGRSWDQTGHRAHITRYRLGRGCFVLCEECWCCLETPAARMPFYRQLWETWRSRQGYETNWDEIEKAVLSEGSGCAGDPVS
jgi:hypothetical protein